MILALGISGLRGKTGVRSDKGGVTALQLLQLQLGLCDKTGGVRRKRESVYNIYNIYILYILYIYIYYYYYYNYYLLFRGVAVLPIVLTVTVTTVTL